MKQQVEVKITTFEDIKHLVAKANKESVSVKKDDKTTYITAFLNGEIIGFVGYMEIKDAIRYKSDYVIPICRGKGIYHLLWDERDKIIRSKYGEVEKTAFCTPKSINTYLKNGFEKVKLNSNGYWFVKQKR